MLRFFVFAAFIATAANAEAGTAAPDVASAPARRVERDEALALARAGVDRLPPGLRELGQGGASYVGSYAPSTLFDRVQVSAPMLQGEKDQLSVGVAASDLHFAEAIALGGPQLALDLYSVSLLSRYS